MPTYTTGAKVLIHLPDDLPASVTNHTANDIADASALCESRVGSCFSLAYEDGAQKFPDIGSDPPTPAMIELAVRYLAVSQQYTRLGGSIPEGEISQADKYESKADKIFTGIDDDKIAVEIAGSNLKSTILDTVQDPIYADTDEAVFNVDDLDGHLY